MSEAHAPVIFARHSDVRVTVPDIDASQAIKSEIELELVP
jgi:hypothetical protein